MKEKEKDTLPHPKQFCKINSRNTLFLLLNFHQSTKHQNAVANNR